MIMLLAIDFNWKAEVCRNRTKLLRHGLLAILLRRMGSFQERPWTSVLGLVPVVFPSEDEHGYTGDVCVESLTELHGGNISVRNSKKEQPQYGVKGEGL